MYVPKGEMILVAPSRFPEALFSFFRESPKSSPDIFCRLDSHGQGQ